MELSTTFPQHGICLSYMQIAATARCGLFYFTAKSDYFRDICKLLHYKELERYVHRIPYRER